MATGLCTFAADYREVIITVHTVWSLVTQRKKQTYFCEDIFVVCGIRRFDDNSVLILRPQSRISWIISPQCIIIIRVEFVTVPVPAPVPAAGFYRYDKRRCLSVLDRGPQTAAVVG